MFDLSLKNPASIIDTALPTTKKKIDSTIIATTNDVKTLFKTLLFLLKLFFLFDSNPRKFFAFVADKIIMWANIDIPEFG